MRLTFLCANHREWLSSRPDQAIHCCANSCEAGWYLCQQQSLEEALPYMGCAFETAEILLKTRVIKPAEALQWFLHTQADVTRVLRKLGRLEDCKSVILMAVDRLEKELSQDVTLKTTITLELNRLAHELRRFSYDNCITQQQFGSAAAQHCWGAATL